MKTLLYIGNMRFSKKAPFSLMEEHGARLEAHFQVFYSSAQPNKVLRMMDMVLTVLKKRRVADCVLINVYSTLNFYYAWVIALLCRGFQLPYIAYLHGGNLPARLKQSPQCSGMIFKHAQANVAPSEYLKKSFEQAGFPTLVIPNFIQLDQYSFSQRTQLRPKLLWVRAFDQTYHPEMSLHVLAEIQQKYPEAQLCMIGPDKDGSLERCKALAVSLCLEKQVEFTGPLSKAQWIARSQEFDLFLNTSRFDNTPVSIVEAMALGLPVVSTDVGGMPYLIKNGVEGLLSPPDDVSAMVQNIQSLLDSAEKAAHLSQNARKKAESLDWLVVEKQWLQLLNQA